MEFMEPKLLEINTALQIQKPANVVFEAIVDPVIMSNYFISRGSGRLDDGKEVTWAFPEFDLEFPVRAGKTEKYKYISFYWEMDGNELIVEISLTQRPDNSTLVSVSEKSMPMSESGLKWLSGNTAGWANFLACLKAWLEYGINLRKGAFDFMKDKS